MFDPELIQLVTHPMFYWYALGIAGGVFVVRRAATSAFMLIGAGILSALSVAVLKALTMQPRPEDALVDVAGHAFPSGHAAGGAFLAFALFATFAPLLPRPWQRGMLAALLTAGALLIGLSRIYLGVHRPDEVLAGFLIGALWGALALVGTKRT